MSSKRELLMWLVVALVATGILVLILIWKYPRVRDQWPVQAAGEPRAGAKLFYGQAGCSRCHRGVGPGGPIAPGLTPPPIAPMPTLASLAAELWNHGPRMWQQAQRAGARPPDLSAGETADLLAFIFITRCVDAPGDAARGRVLFSAQGCPACHSERNPALALPRLEEAARSSLRWAQGMWGHAAAMHSDAPRHEVWPAVGTAEMRDLFAFVRGPRDSDRSQSELLAADPKRGWNLLRARGCLGCHSVRGYGARSAPELGAGEPGLTPLGLAALLWNHAPRMASELAASGQARGPLEERDVADLLAFLCGLRFADPAGSPLIGGTVFMERGCAACHGPEAAGSGAAPALRGRARPLSTVWLAASLWRHGAALTQTAQGTLQRWPELRERDIGDLVAYLNSPVRGGR